jgi:hypothetical protein
MAQHCNSIYKDENNLKKEMAGLQKCINGGFEILAAFVMKSFIF